MQVVHDYLAKHPEATPSEISAALQKTGIHVKPAYAANVKSLLKKNGHKSTAAAPVAAQASSDEPKPHRNGNGSVITMEQIKLVAKTVRTLGGAAGTHQVLEAVSELGGVKKFRELVDALAAS